MATVTTSLEEWEGRSNELRSLRAQLSREQRHQNYYNVVAGDLLAEQLFGHTWVTMGEARFRRLSFAGLISRPEGSWGSVS